MNIFHIGVRHWRVTLPIGCGMWLGSFFVSDPLGSLMALLAIIPMFVGSFGFGRWLRDRSS